MNNKEIGLQRMANIVQFLYQFRIATNEQLFRACSQGDKPSKTARSRILTKLKTRGVIKDYTPFCAAKKVWSVTNNGELYTPVSWVTPTNAASLPQRQFMHTLCVSSIASQILNETEINPLGLPNNEWESIRDGITNNTTYLVSEHEINTAWSQKVEELGIDTLRDIYATSIERGTNMKSCMLETVRNYEAGTVWKWRLATSIYAYDPKLKTFLDAENVLDINQLPKRATFPGDDRILLSDHPIDLGVCVDNGTENPYTVAIEVELTTKNLQNYISTIASYQSPLGLALFDRVVWLCTDNSTINKLNKAIETVGNINNQIIVKKVMPVQSTRMWIGTDVAVEENIDYVRYRLEHPNTTKKTNNEQPTNTKSTTNTRQQNNVPTFNVSFLDTDEDSGTSNPFNGLKR